MPAVLAETAAVPDVRGKLAAYADLTKPKIAAMALVTVAAGYLLGAAPTPRIEWLLHTLVGTALVAAGGSALNCWLERRNDALMPRTRNRSLPAGRLSPAEALAFGLAVTLAGILYLAVALPHPLAAGVAACTALLYVGVYTPLKQYTAWNTVVGAIPGALPPVIGWAAARGELTAEAAALFAVLFVWQLPHFYSIAWIYRNDYARGGMRMLPHADRADGYWTGISTVGTCVLLLAAAVTPYFAGAAGTAYLLGSGLVGAWFLARCVRFAADRNNATAKSVLRGSLVYLLAVMLLMTFDGLLPKYLG
jgi:heme o synthase